MLPAAPEVRNCAVKSLTSALFAHGRKVGVACYKRCLQDILIEVLSEIQEQGRLARSSKGVGGASGLLVHHSRDTPEKQWDETTVLAVEGVRRVLSNFAEEAGDVEFAPLAYVFLLQVQSSLRALSPEVSGTALRALVDLMRVPASSHEFDSDVLAISAALPVPAKGKTSVWLLCWDVLWGMVGFCLTHEVPEALIEMFASTLSSLRNSHHQLFTPVRRPPSCSAARHEDPSFYLPSSAPLRSAGAAEGRGPAHAEALAAAAAACAEAGSAEVAGAHDEEIFAFAGAAPDILWKVEGRRPAGAAASSYAKAPVAVSCYVEANQNRNLDVRSVEFALRSLEQPPGAPGAEGDAARPDEEVVQTFLGTTQSPTHRTMLHVSAPRVQHVQGFALGLLEEAQGFPQPALEVFFLYMLCSVFLDARRVLLDTNKVALAARAMCLLVLFCRRVVLHNLCRLGTAACRGRADAVAHLEALLAVSLPHVLRSLMALARSDGPSGLREAGLWKLALETAVYLVDDSLPAVERGEVSKKTCAAYWAAVSEVLGAAVKSALHEPEAAAAAAPGAAPLLVEALGGLCAQRALPCATVPAEVSERVVGLLGELDAASGRLGAGRGALGHLFDLCSRPQEAPAGAGPAAEGVGGADQIHEGSQQEENRLGPPKGGTAKAGCGKRGRLEAAAALLDGHHGSAAPSFARQVGSGGVAAADASSTRAQDAVGRSGAQRGRPADLVAEAGGRQRSGSLGVRIVGVAQALEPDADPEEAKLAQFVELPRLSGDELAGAKYRRRLDALRAQRLVARPLSVAEAGAARDAAAAALDDALAEAEELQRRLGQATERVAKCTATLAVQALASTVAPAAAPGGGARCGAASRRGCSNACGCAYGPRCPAPAAAAAAGSQQEAPAQAPQRRVQCMEVVTSCGFWTSRARLGEYEFMDADPARCVGLKRMESDAFGNGRDATWLCVGDFGTCGSLRRRHVGHHLDWILLLAGSFGQRLGELMAPAAAEPRVRDARGAACWGGASGAAGARPRGARAPSRGARDGCDGRGPGRLDANPLLDWILHLALLLGHRHLALRALLAGSAPALAGRLGRGLAARGPPARMRPGWAPTTPAARLLRMLGPGRSPAAQGPPPLARAKRRPRAPEGPARGALGGARRVAAQISGAYEQLRNGLLADDGRAFGAAALAARGGAPARLPPRLPGRGALLAAAMPALLARLRTLFATFAEDEASAGPDGPPAHAAEDVAQALARLAAAELDPAALAELSPSAAAKAKAACELAGPRGLTLTLLPQLARLAASADPGVRRGVSGALRGLSTELEL
ncbi:unnamed protein product [Prorocentrum cordatum]|uniref:Mon2 C-terminal domain-containing protein n=1 Tax=Prorocentrum cordatum TaxID=2364126 RepID=A0ABN9PIT4_9DINO|nr:unnamed protein product [Polarella glacialis]